MRRKLPNAITIFLKPSALDDLLPRLEARGTETPAERAIRMQTAEREMLCVSDYDYVVVNAPYQLDAAVEDVKAIIRAERLRVQPRLVTV
jgi:guanylate kinase